MVSVKVIVTRRCGIARISFPEIAGWDNRRELASPSVSRILTDTRSEDMKGIFSSGNIRFFPNDCRKSAIEIHFPEFPNLLTTSIGGITEEIQSRVSLVREELGLEPLMISFCIEE